MTCKDSIVAFISDCLSMDIPPNSGFYVPSFHQCSLFFLSNCEILALKFLLACFEVDVWMLEVVLGYFESFE